MVSTKEARRNKGSNKTPKRPEVVPEEYLDHAKSKLLVEVLEHRPKLKTITRNDGMSYLEAIQEKLQNVAELRQWLDKFEKADKDPGQRLALISSMVTRFPGIDNQTKTFRSRCVEKVMGFVGKTHWTRFLGGLKDASTMMGEKYRSLCREGCPDECNIDQVLAQISHEDRTLDPLLLIQLFNKIQCDPSAHFLQLGQIDDALTIILRTINDTMEDCIGELVREGGNYREKWADESDREQRVAATVVGRPADNAKAQRSISFNERMAMSSMASPISEDVRRQFETQEAAFTVPEPRPCHMNDAWHHVAMRSTNKVKVEYDMVRLLAGYMQDKGISPLSVINAPSNASILRFFDHLRPGEYLSLEIIVSWMREEGASILI